MRMRRMSEFNSSKLASVFLVKWESDYLPRVAIRWGRSYPRTELIHAVLRMTERQIHLNQATEAAGEGNSALQGSGFSGKSPWCPRTEMYPPRPPHAQKHIRYTINNPSCLKFLCIQVLRHLAER